MSDEVKARGGPERLLDELDRDLIQTGTAYLLVYSPPALSGLGLWRLPPECVSDFSDPLPKPFRVSDSGDPDYFRKRGLPCCHGDAFSRDEVFVFRVRSDMTHVIKRVGRRNWLAGLVGETLLRLFNGQKLANLPAVPPLGVPAGNPEVAGSEMSAEDKPRWKPGREWL